MFVRVLKFLLVLKLIVGLTSGKLSLHKTVLLRHRKKRTTRPPAWVMSKILLIYFLLPKYSVNEKNWKKKL